ncbi:hypothetical protein [Thermodesulfovibrio yellowstonii]|jgi:hypothetical protein|uniref:Uncharacterized protein n=1 Tax=Thermodesulfovibrio yellowstonii TaxID=28262 RepID=A0A9W6GER5_9BACT|nr:hypothetical protein [Thermodesulfovibrio islandicus]GLI52392.1 hypothetical protein TISLANDTSLP1_00850 [Thermodesulfovibrio islandicus]
MSLSAPISKKEKLNPLITPIVTQDIADRVTNAIIEFISKVARFPEVIKVAYKPKGNIITIWTFIKKPEKNLLFSIYEIEHQIMEKFPELIFDFTVIFKNSESPTGFYEQIISE